MWTTPIHGLGSPAKSKEGVCGTPVFVLLLPDCALSHVTCTQLPGAPAAMPPSPQTAFSNNKLFCYIHLVFCYSNKTDDQSP